MVTKQKLINLTLNEGDIVDIYTDYQEEIGYEGKARLIKKIRPGDSYYLKEEKIKPVDKKEYTKRELAEIHKYKRLTTLFKGNNGMVNVHCRRLLKKLMAERKDQLDDYERMQVVLNEYREQFQDSIHKVGCILREYDDYYIYRYVHQDRKIWQPSIFSYERWLVEFITDSSGWEVSWKTERNIRILKCVNPSESLRKCELLEHTTYDNGIPSKDRERITNFSKYLEKKARKLRLLELGEVDEFDEDDDDLDENLDEDE